MSAAFAHDMAMAGSGDGAADKGVYHIGARAIADELVELTARLSDLAYQLGSDPHTLRQHMGSLQAIDLITQIQLGLADMLRSTAPFEDRIDAITLQALADRMRARIQG